MRNLLGSSVPHLRKYVHHMYIITVFGLTLAILDLFRLMNISSQSLMRHTLKMEAKSAPETSVTT
jgi:hypothetical protein